MKKTHAKKTLPVPIEDVLAQVDKTTTYVGMHVSQLCVMRKGDKSTIETEDDKELLRLGYTIVDPKHLAPIGRIASKPRVWLRDRIALPNPLFNGAGIYLVPVACGPMIRDVLLEAQREFDAAADDFADHYSEYLADARMRLKASGGKRAPRAEEVRAKFSFTYRFFKIKGSDNLADVSEVMNAEECAKAHADMEATVATIRDGLRTAFADLVAHFVKRLGTCEEGKRAGKRRVLSKSTLPLVLEFLDTFSKRNVVGDGELATLVAQAQGLVRGVDTESLKSDSSTHDHVLKGFEAIQSTITKMGVEIRTRRIQLDDEE